MELTDAKSVSALLERHHFRFSRSMGQNFLIDPAVPEELCESAMLDKATGVLEIGPGIGCLTAKLAEKAGRVVSIELDRTLAPVLSETLEGRDNVEIVYADALRLDLAALCAEKLSGLRLVVCANIPYNVTSPLLTAFIKAGCFETMTLLCQREVAERLCAPPGTADYGAFTVFVNWHCVPETLFEVSPECFMPAPKVTSAIIRLTTRKTPPVAVSDEAFMFRIIRAAFGQRRKSLANALKNGLPELNREHIAAAIAECGLDPMVRGETLSMEKFAFLSDFLKKEC